MFPIFGRNSAFTYDNLREVRLDPLWISLASTVAAAFVVVVALTASGQPSVQADAQASADTAFVAPVGTDDADDAVAAP
jgi:hypothetical protein